MYRLFLLCHKNFIQPIMAYFFVFTNYNCRFRPTCSEFSATAIDRHGFYRGGIMGLGRILRCNPLSKSGFDPVREKISK